MEFGISTQIYRRQAVTVDVLESIRRAGYRQIELFANRPHLDFHNRSLVRAIGNWFQENVLPAPSIHLPFMETFGETQKRWITPLHPDFRQRAFAIDEMKRCLEIADRVPIAYAVLHLGIPSEEYNPVLFEHAYTAISQIRTFSGVKIMIENIPNEISTFDRIEEFKTVTRVQDIGICYDTGHGHLQRIEPDFRRINATHIHDNLGRTDDHLWPFEGSLNWPALVEKFVLAEYKGSFVFETRGEELNKSGDVQKRFQELFDEAEESLDEYRLRHALSSKVSEES